MSTNLGEPFAVVKWHAGDVMDLASQLGYDWDEERAHHFMDMNDKHMCNRLTELGWEVMEVFMSMDIVDDDEGIT